MNIVSKSNAMLGQCFIFEHLHNSGYPLVVACIKSN